MRSKTPCGSYVVYVMAALLATIVYARAAAAQSGAVDEWRGQGQVVIPQLGGFPLDGGAALWVTAMAWDVRVDGPLAVVAVSVELHNRSDRTAAAEMILPVPRGAVVRGFDFLGEGTEPSARLLPAEEARRSYNAIVARAIDPALLEFAGSAAIRTSVFPVPPHGAQALRITYEQLLEGDGSRFDLVLPRSEAWRFGGPSIEVDIEVRGPAAVGSLWSPSHAITTSRGADGALTARLAPGAEEQPGSIRLCLLASGSGPGATLFAHPDPLGDGGTFLLLGTLPERARAPKRRELALVIDRSGSMAGEKFEQVRGAAIEALRSLRTDETFQLVVFSGSVDTFTDGAQAAEPARIEAACQWLLELKPGGGTNISDALATVLRETPDPVVLPLVVLLTDGQPTVGLRDEAALTAAAQQLNVHGRRIHLLGVGHDVNAPLLDQLAHASAGTSQFAHPGEDAGAAFLHLASRLSLPRFTGIAIEAIGADGALDVAAIRERVPEVIEDAYEGEQTVLLGRYRKGATRLGFRVAGELDGEPLISRFEFDISGAALENAFVSRLWAQRRIAALVDHVRRQGAGTGAAAAISAELVEEVRMLSQRWGILSEYTAFLALEGTDLANEMVNRTALSSSLLNRAQRTRTGAAGVVQSVNQTRWRRGHRVDRLNRFLDEQLRENTVTRVQHVGERAFFLRGGKWVDTRLFEGGANAVAQLQLLTSVPFGSDGYRDFTKWLDARGLAGVLALSGDVLVEVQGRAVWVPRPKRNSAPAPEAAAGPPAEPMAASDDA